MATKGNSGENRARSSITLFIVIGLCCFFYLLGAWQRSGYGKGDSIALQMTKTGTDCNILPNLNFETHHSGDTVITDNSVTKVKDFKPCSSKYTDYTPCHDQKRAMTFPRHDMIYRERHCPPQEQKLKCLVPAPKGYVTPFSWPKSRDYVPFANAPYKALTVEKAIQNWIQYEGNVFRFPGGGTQFPQGADAYIDQLASVIPIDNGTVRTALDTGCGVASWGAYLWKRNVVTMSFAPRDNHEAQVQFALERGVPAIVGVLGSIKMPFPSKAFDMAHCSRCLIPWGSNDGKYMMEVDRVLRPGGFWVLSGPPINWRSNYKSWQRPKEDLEEEQRNIEEVAKLLCWDKISESGETIIFQKRLNPQSCRVSELTYCSQNPDDVWYKKMETCVTPTNSNTRMEYKPFPERLYATPPRIASGSIPVSEDKYIEDNKQWKKHLSAYKRINRLIDSGRYRNIMDMNAGLGGFAAAINSQKLWVMNVVPTLAENTLGVIYERGLIGIYHDWYHFSRSSVSAKMVNPTISDSEKKSITHVIFDMDGLLLDTEKFYTEVQEIILSRFNKTFDWSLKAKMMGMKAIEAARVFVQETGISDSLSAEDFLVEREAMLQTMFPTSDLMPGASRLVKHLHATGVPICVATGSHKRHFELKTQRHGEIFSLMHHIVMGDDPEVKQGKP